MTQNIWAEMGKNYHFEEREDMQIIVDMIKEDGIKSLLECSVGSGIFPIMLRKSGYEGLYLGSDYVNSFLDNAKENNPTENFRKIDLNEAIPIMDKSFEASVVIHGLDYVNSYFNTLKELKRITSKFIYIDLWQDFINENDQMRFNEGGKWGVNTYNREKFYASLKNLGLEPVVDILNINPLSKTNRIMKLKIL